MSMTAAAVAHDGGGSMMTGPRRRRPEPASISLDDVGETLAEAVARAAAGMTNSAVAQRAGMSTRTLRDILNPNTARRFGRATLNKLDGPLGWPPGRAWSLYLSDGPEPDVAVVAEAIAQVQALARRVSALEQRPSWAAELLEVCVGLDDQKRAKVIEYARFQLSHGG